MELGNVYDDSVITFFIWLTAQAFGIISNHAGEHDPQVLNKLVEFRLVEFRLVECCYSTFHLYCDAGYIICIGGKSSNSKEKIIKEKMSN